MEAVNNYKTSLLKEYYELVTMLNLTSRRLLNEKPETLNGLNSEDVGINALAGYSAKIVEINTALKTLERIKVYEV